MNFSPGGSRQNEAEEAPLVVQEVKEPDICGMTVLRIVALQLFLTVAILAALGGFVGHYWHNIHGDVETSENTVKNLPAMQKQLQSALGQLNGLSSQLTELKGNPTGF